MQTDLTQLEALARAATPGDWHVSGKRPWEVLNDRNYIVAAADGPVVSTRGDSNYGDAAYIAAANPSAILALIKRVRTAEANLALTERDYADLKDGSYKQWKALAQLEIRYKSLLRSLTHAAAMSPPKPVLVEKDPTP